MRHWSPAAGGFLGRYRRRAVVARGDRVRAFCRGRLSASSARLGVECRQGDVRDRDAVVAACAGMRVVFHTPAWPASGGLGSTSTGSTRSARSTSSKAAASTASARLVYTSSPSVTFDGARQERRRRVGPVSHAWLCHYPHTKALAEQQVLAAHGRGDLSPAPAAALDLGAARSASDSAVDDGPAADNCAAWATARI